MVLFFPTIYKKAMDCGASNIGTQLSIPSGSMRIISVGINGLNFLVRETDSNNKGIAVSCPHIRKES